MTRKITQHLMENKSYFKWGKTRLAEKFGCSERTISNILRKLDSVKREYLRNLGN